MNVQGVRPAPLFPVGAVAALHGVQVLADGGLCCIDEFDGIRPAERAVIHEVSARGLMGVGHTPYDRLLLEDGGVYL